jgi:CheY-like chemotaxis protein
MTSSQTVLVVEDNDEAREGLAVLLRREGYQVLLAEHGEEGLRHLRAGARPDLVLLDMLMPVLDGWHFLEQLRQQEPLVPVIIMTGSVLTREWALEHGCQGFLRKPIQPELLLGEVQRCLAGPSGQADVRPSGV